MRHRHTKTCLTFTRMNRALMTAAFRGYVSDAVPFDEELQIITARGKYL